MNKKYVLDIPDLNTFKKHFMAHVEALVASTGHDVLSAIKPEVVPEINASARTEALVDGLMNFVFESIKDSHIRLAGGIEHGNGPAKTRSIQLQQETNHMVGT